MRRVERVGQVAVSSWRASRHGQVVYIYTHVVFHLHIMFRSFKRKQATRKNIIPPSRKVRAYTPRCLSLSPPRSSSIHSRSSIYSGSLCCGEQLLNVRRHDVGQNAPDLGAAAPDQRGEQGPEPRELRLELQRRAARETSEHLHHERRGAAQVPARPVQAHEARWLQAESKGERERERERRSTGRGGVSRSVGEEERAAPVLPVACACLERRRAQQRPRVVCPLTLQL